MKQQEYILVLDVNEHYVGGVEDLIRVRLNTTDIGQLKVVSINRWGVPGRRLPGQPNTGNFLKDGNGNEIHINSRVKIEGMHLQDEFGGARFVDAGTFCAKFPDIALMPGIEVGTFLPRL
jgi:hypothetical protein